MTENDAFPGYPDWLEAAEFAAGEGLTDKIPAHVVEILALHRRAATGSTEAAEKIAEAYETGELPCSGCVYKAAAWHHYAAEIGSVKSALRLARLNGWADDIGKSASSSVNRMAEKAIRNLLKSYQDKSGLNAAAQAALLLLDNNATVGELLIIEELLSTKKFVGHPELELISNRVQLARCQREDSGMSLRIASARMHDDNDFKAGIYKSLERPLPLIGLPDADHVKQVLDAEFPWFSAVNELVFRQLVVQQHSSVPAFKLRPLLIAGPAGVGKTTWVRRLSELCSVPFRSVMAAGGADSMFLRGTPRGWSTSRPGAVLQTMATEMVGNPLFLVDELEKASTDNRNGRTWDVLLQMLEPSTARVYLDECLQVPCDLSWVSWIATVNEIGQLPKPLLERFTVVAVPAPGSEHFQTLVTGVLNSFAKELGLDSRMLPALDADDLDVLRMCNGPREINRTARMMVEKKLVSDRRKMMRN